MTTKTAPVNFAHLASIILAQANRQLPYKDPLKGHGGMGPVWAQHSSKVSQFITENKLVVAKEMLRNSFDASDQLTMQQYFTEDWLDWQGLNGGWPGPHVHYANDMYPVTVSQWQSFSKPLVAELTQKLSAAKTVTFAQFQALANI